MVGIARSSQSQVGIDHVDEGVGGGVVGGGGLPCAQFWLDGLGELLAELNAGNQTKRI